MSQPMTQTLVVHQMRAENCFAYLLADVEAREAALVDPRVDRVAEYLADLEERGLRLRFVIETHTHADHLSGAAELRARTGAEVLIRPRRSPTSRRGGCVMAIVSPSDVARSRSSRVPGTPTTP